MLGVPANYYEWLLHEIPHIYQRFCSYPLLTMKEIHLSTRQSRGACLTYKQAVLMSPTHIKSESATKYGIGRHGYILSILREAKAHLRRRPHGRLVPLAQGAGPRWTRRKEDQRRKTEPEVHEQGSEWAKNSNLEEAFGQSFALTRDCGLARQNKQTTKGLRPTRQNRHPSIKQRNLIFC